MCGARGCWEVYTSNLAMMSRYFGWDLSELSPKVLRDSEKHPFSILELIERARAGDAKAIGALETSARFLGLGLANIVKTINPDCIYLSGEIMTGWDMIASALTERGVGFWGQSSQLTMKAARILEFNGGKRHAKHKEHRAASVFDWHCRRDSPNGGLRGNQLFRTNHLRPHLRSDTGQTRGRYPKRLCDADE